MQNKKYNLGVDLGTTNSLLCVYNDTYSRPDVVKLNSKNGTIPSVVYYDKEKDSYIVGEEAKEQADYYVDSFAFLKTKMHLGEESASEINGKKMSPVEFSKIILDYIYDGFVEQFGKDAVIENLVVTVPAYFKDVERRNTMKAIKKSKFKVKNEIRLINEPTAATLSYSDGLDTAKTVVTYDLGGGTFDVTLLEVEDIDEVKVFQAIKTDGKTLGGYNFDDLITEMLIEQLKKDADVTDSDLPFIKNSLRAESEKIKIGLSKLDSMSGTCVARSEDSKHMIDYRIDKTDFENSIDELIEQTIDMTKEIIGSNQIDKIVLVGGSTRIPLVEEKLSDEFGKEKIEKVDPDLVVGYGAAIQSAIINRDRDSILNEILSGGGIGVSVKGDFVKYMVKEGTPIPFSISERFVTSSAGTSLVETYIVQGKDVNLEAGDNVILGKITLDNLVVTEQSSIIDVKINVNKSGEVEIIASEAAKGGATAVKLLKSTDKDKIELNLLDFKNGIAVYDKLSESEIVTKAEKIVGVLEKEDSPIAEDTTDWLLEQFDSSLLLRDINKLKRLIYRFEVLVMP